MAFHKPFWIEQGPGPMKVFSGGYHAAAGAAQAIVVDPVDPNRVFVATVGGGVWRSMNARSAMDPVWEPLTDHASSLTMSTLVLSTLDPKRNTLYAGYGRTSHGAPLVGPNGGPLFGLLKTVNGGTTWKELARTEFQAKYVVKILPLAQTKLGERLLVATLEGGLHVSPDGGVTWNRSAAVSAPVTDLVADPSNPRRVYVAANMRIFRSEDGGDQNWTDITPPAWSVPPLGGFIRICVSPTTDLSGNHWLYAFEAGAAAGVCMLCSADRGANWNRIGQPPDGSAPVSPFVVSPLSPKTLICLTNAGAPNHWMANVSPGQPTQWTLVENQGANGTGPHTDSRDLAFVSDGSVLFEVDDGGVYRLSNPHGFWYLGPRRWTPAVGNIRIAEFHSIAYDSVNHILFGATQDNSIPQQSLRNGLYWEGNEDEWGDGFVAGVDNSTNPGAAVHYSSQQNLFRFVRRTYIGPKQVTSSDYMKVVIAGTGGQTYNQVEGAIREDGSLGTVRWNQSWAVNQIDPKRILLGTDYLYESFDRGDTFVSLGGLMKNKNGNWMPKNPIGTITAYAYGHRNNRDVIYVGTADGKLWLRTGNAGLPSTITTYPGGKPRSIAMDPNDWCRAYVVDEAGRVYRTADARSSTGRWTEITGDLPTLTGDLRSIRAVPFGGEVIFVAGHGGVFFLENPGDGRFARWRKHGMNLPNAVVMDLHYDAKDDVMIAGTFGRGAWTLPNASSTVAGAPRCTIVSTQRFSCLDGWLENSNVRFSPVITDKASLALPLSYRWQVLGATPQSSLTGSSILVRMPAAGSEVVILLTIRDVTGYQVHGLLIGASVSLEVGINRERWCHLLGTIRQATIFNPFLNPLGPDVPSGVDPLNWWRDQRTGPLTIGGLPDYSGFHQLMTRFTEVLGWLAEHDRVEKTLPTLHEMSGSQIERWASLEQATGNISMRFGPSDADEGRREVSVPHNLREPLKKPSLENSEET